MSVSGAADLLTRLRAQPGGRDLLAAAAPRTFLVGGAVRDLLLGRCPRELDVVVQEGEGAPFGHAAALLAKRLAAGLVIDAPSGSDGEPRPSTSRRDSDGPRGRPGGAREHARFGTAIVEWGSGRIDIATARRERYPAPGALPEVQGAPLAEDLLRRDFTVNALAVGLDGERPGELHAAPGALEDLHTERLRVLHERSFLDDPTRLWRLARYSARLGFAVEERTAQLAAEALAGGALRTVSGARIGAELRLALAEDDALASLAALEHLGLLAALHPRARFEAPVAHRALELLAADGVGADRGSPGRGRPGGGRATARGGRPADGRPADGRPDLLLLSALLLPLALRADGDPRAEIGALLDRLEFPAGDRDRVAAAAAADPRLVEELPRQARPLQLRALALPVPPEGVALAAAVSAPAAPAARRWLQELRHVRLRITGEDLLAAGVPQGPEIGRRLEETLALRLEGELPDEHGAQLQAALR